MTFHCPNAISEIPHKKENKTTCVSSSTPQLVRHYPCILTAAQADSVSYLRWSHSETSVRKSDHQSDSTNWALVDRWMPALSILIFWSPLFPVPVLSGPPVELVSETFGSYVKVSYDVAEGSKGQQLCAVVDQSSFHCATVESLCYCMRARFPGGIYHVRDIVTAHPPSFFHASKATISLMDFSLPTM